MSKKLILTLTVVFALANASYADQGNSQGRGRGNGGNTGGNSSSDVKVSVAVIFNDHDRTTFRDYFTTHKIVAQSLPPGIAKNVERGKPLPPGIAKKAIPQDLIVTLGPRAASGMTFSIVGDRVVALRSGVVVDVLLNVFK